jgi:acyl carrier protein
LNSSQDNLADTNRSAVSIPGDHPTISGRNGVAARVEMLAGAKPLLELRDRIRRDGILELHCGPSLFRRLCESLPDGRGFPSIRLVRLSGEMALNYDVKLFQRHFSKEARLVNAFTTSLAEGPLCEFTVDHSTPATFDELPVGHPLPGVEIAILDASGNCLREGKKGEVALRRGNNFEKTGDIGRILPGHGLVLLGKIDGWFKIRGQWVDPGLVRSVLREHPAVVECAVSEWGSGSQSRQLVAWVKTRREPEGLRGHLAARLPDWMIPASIVQVESLDHLPDPFASRPTEPNDAPVNAIELRLMKIWKKLLRRKTVGMNDSFFDSGGDSLLGAVLLSRIQESFGVELPLEDLVARPTIRGIAKSIRDTPSDREFAPMLLLKSSGSKPPVFWAPGAGIYAGADKRLGELLENDHPFYALRYKGIDGVELPLTSVEEIAAYFVEEIRKVQPGGPYHLGGSSFGGLVAYETARQLTLSGETVAVVVIEDTRIENELVPKTGLPLTARLKRYLRNFMPLGQRENVSWPGLCAGFRQIRFRRAVPKKRRLCQKLQIELPKVYRFHEVLNTSLDASKSYQPPPYAGGPVILFRSTDDGGLSQWFELDATLGWGRYCDQLRIIDLSGKHSERDRNEAILAEFAKKLDTVLSNVDDTAG